MLHLLPWVFLIPMPAPFSPDLPVGDGPVVTVEPSQECPKGVTCVPDEEMETFIQLLRDQKCREATKPEFTSDGVNIVVDREGRVYGSGTGDKPYKLHMDWCNYELDAEAQIHLDVAQRVEPTWGFRLRLKATAGLLVVDAFTEDKIYEAIDGGLLVDAFFVQWFNLNAYIGFRSFGAGAGVDITQHFGAYAGYALTWASWRSNPFVGIYFEF